MQRSFDAAYAPAGANLQVDRAEQFCGDGFLLVDKPLGMTSHDVIGKLRRVCATRKIGHAGTLDPAASGLLVIGVGGMTRALTYIGDHHKTYLARIVFGVETDTEDAQGRVIAAVGAGERARRELAAALAELTGPQLQVPSAVSAKKIAGKRAHELVRDGEQPRLAAVPIEINRLELNGEVSPGQLICEIGSYLPGRAPDRHVGPEQLQMRGAGQQVAVVYADILVDCSAGTFVRALARDLGKMLGCGAHLCALRRIRSGRLTIDRAFELPEIARDPGACLINPEQFARATWPVYSLPTKAEIAALKCGKTLAAPGLEAELEGAAIALVSPGRLHGFGHLKNGVLQPRTVIASSFS